MLLYFFLCGLVKGLEDADEVCTAVLLAKAKHVGMHLERIIVCLRPRRVSPSVIAFCVVFLLLANSTWCVGRTSGDSSVLFLALLAIAMYLVLSRVFLMVRNRGNRPLFWQDVVEMAAPVLVFIGIFRYEDALAASVEKRLIERSVSSSLVTDAGRILGDRIGTGDDLLSVRSLPESVGMLRPLEVRIRFNCLWLLRRGYGRRVRKKWVIVCPHRELPQSVCDYLSAGKYEPMPLDDRGVYVTVDLLNMW